ncbi:lysozyme family protein [Enterococcus dongliensis]|uniref:lysozyme family protein n=1 Tax=Enterococcus dongliensis TaxID=2559925 RepID=UPI00288E67CD|nr:lysozyme family protein [Enterococcus dongliensis]MDT2613746.1 lysozyme family protein [Enterococcus dongliensis]MDT2639428.1 lysozyme family protein [Enterococcus dongliensis]
MAKIIGRFFKIISVLAILTVLIIGILFAVRTYKHTKTVNSYRSNVQTLANQAEIGEYTDVILGIMYTESKGKGTDLMQSSESAYGSRGKISSQQESIESGVKHFAESYEQAKAAGCDLDTAIQAYNFGTKYIQYVQKNGGKNSVELAEKYSRDVLSPGYGNDQQSMYRYMQVQSVFYNGGYLYQNGGNMFYAEIVQMNKQLLMLFQRFQ